MPELLQPREPMRSKSELMQEFDLPVNGARLRFEVEVDRRDLEHELRIQQTRKNRILEAIAQKITGKSLEEIYGGV